MKSSIIKYLTFFLLIGMSSGELFSQSRKELEKKKNKLLGEIDYANKRLEETRKNKKLSLNELFMLNKKIGMRKELISTMNSELYLINKDIKKTSQVIEDLKSELEKLKEDYAKMIYFAYKNRDAYSRMMYIFAAEDFNQAYLRLKYFQQYSEYRKKQAELIIKTQQELKETKSVLIQKKNEKLELLGRQKVEEETLTKEKVDKEDVLAGLQKTENQLKADLKKKRKDADKLQEAIKRIIAEEIKKANAAANASNSKTLLLTPEAKKLSESFASNQGKLPWPVLKGIIVDRFGDHPHPVIKGVQISNNGIDINTSQGALARAVFNGVVSGVASVPGSGKVVIIRHGEYLSVYANLNEVFVKQGDKIETKQNIGTVLQKAGESDTELHLEIWKGQTKLNPESWLFRQ